MTLSTACKHSYEHSHLDESVLLAISSGINDLRFLSIKAVTCGYVLLILEKGSLILINSSHNPSRVLSVLLISIIPHEKMQVKGVRGSL